MEVLDLSDMPELTHVRRNKVYESFFSRGTSKRATLELFIEKTREPCARATNTDDVHQYTAVCEHHWLPFTGKLIINVIGAKFWIGQKKYNELIQLICNKPTTQDKIVNELGTVLIKGLAAQSVEVLCTAQHTCMQMQGIHDISNVSCKITSEDL